MVTDEIFGEMMSLMRRERKRVRHAEHLGPREAAESIDGLRAAFESARDALRTGDVDKARAILREDLEDDDPDDN